MDVASCKKKNLFINLSGYTLGVPRVDELESL